MIGFPLKLSAPGFFSKPAVYVSDCLYMYVQIIVSIGLFVLPEALFGIAGTFSQINGVYEGRGGPPRPRG